MKMEMKKKEQKEKKDAQRRIVNLPVILSRSFSFSSMQTYTHRQRHWAHHKPKYTTSARVQKQGHALLMWTGTG